MKTGHKIIFENSNNMKEVPSGSVNLVVTSPPYPMIEMWDEQFSTSNNEIRDFSESQARTMFRTISASPSPNSPLNLSKSFH